MLDHPWLPSELNAAFLWAQLQAAEEITARRLGIWARYHEAFADAEAQGLVRRPIVPAHCTNNAHMYYLLLRSLEHRAEFISALKEHAIQSVFHYVPLHSAPVGKRLGRVSGSMHQTDTLSERLVRLPMWAGLEQQQDQVIDRALKALRS